MFVLWKKIEFYKGQRDCKAIVMIAWGLGQSPDGVSGGKALALVEEYINIHNQNSNIFLIFI